MPTATAALLAAAAATAAPAAAAATAVVVAAAGTCPLPAANDTLFFLDPADPYLLKVDAAAAADCCDLCASSSPAGCMTWSFSTHWGPSTPPCHLSWRPPLRNETGHTNSSGGSTYAPPSLRPGSFWIDNASPSGRRQVFEGVMVELQSDSIGSDNEGMPDNTISVPHDLVPSERVRFATEVLRGTRTIRLAMGLYLRGLTPDGRNIAGRWPEQMAELKQLNDLSGIEGWAPEYWSPPPRWKSTGSWYNGTLANFTDAFLEDFCSVGVLGDVAYLNASGLRVTWWGLQNEPLWDRTNITAKQACEHDAEAAAAGATSPPEPSGRDIGPGAGPLQANTYSMCKYTQCQYYQAFKACAPKIRSFDPNIRIHACSATGQLGAAPIALDPETQELVDAFTWHTVNADSVETFGNNTKLWAYGKFDLTNEMEYQPGNKLAGTAVGTVDLLNTFLNTLTFKDSPTGVIMLHAAKPTTNLEGLGYGWTWWWPTNGTATPSLPGLTQPNHFTYNYWNWPAVAPFIKTVPWNSVRLHVAEDVQRQAQRVVAFETPEIGHGGPLHTRTAAGKLIVVITNENGMADFNATIWTTDAQSRQWDGVQHFGSSDGTGFNVSLGRRSSEDGGLRVSLPPTTIQWWYEV